MVGRADLALALALSGTYSMTAALGSATGGRVNAAAIETAGTDARAKAQVAYDAAKAELDALTAAKPATELQALIEGAKADMAKLPAARSVAEVEASLRATQREPQRYGCAMINGSMALSCPKLDAELARARQRDRLTAKIAGWNEEIERADQRRAEQRSRTQAAMNAASVELARLPTAKVANSDAKALARYLAAIGGDVTPERLNDLLVLLAVLMIEAGGGLSLAVGMALSGPVGRAAAASPDASASEARTPAAAVGEATAARPDAPDSGVPSGRTRRADASANAPDASHDTPYDASARAVVERPLASSARARRVSDVVEWLHVRRGRAVVGMRRLGADLGCSASKAHDDVRRLVVDGVLRATPSPRGTLLELVAVGLVN